MSEKERVELEVCVDVLSSLIAGFHIIASKQNISLNKDDNVGVYYRNVIKYVNLLQTILTRKLPRSLVQMNCQASPIDGSEIHISLPFFSFFK